MANTARSAWRHQNLRYGSIAVCSRSIAARQCAVRIRLTQPIGPATLATLDWDGGSLSARLPGLVKLARGDAVGISLTPEHVMLFDRESGRRLPGT